MDRGARDGHAHGPARTLGGARGAVEAGALDHTCDFLVAGSATAFGFTSSKDREEAVDAKAREKCRLLRDLTPRVFVVAGKARPFGGSTCPPRSDVDETWYDHGHRGRARKKIMSQHIVNTSERPLLMSTTLGHRKDAEHNAERPQEFARNKLKQQIATRVIDVPDTTCERKSRYHIPCALPSKGFIIALFYACLLLATPLCLEYANVSYEQRVRGLIIGASAVLALTVARRRPSRGST